MIVCKHVTPLIVILLLTVLFVGVVTTHPTIHTASATVGGTGLQYKGISYTSFSPNEYASAASETSLDALKGTGANYVSVLVTQFVTSETSNSIFLDPQQTPSDAAVTRAIKDAHALGMGVLLKPQIVCNDGSCGQASLNPTDKTAWFASYAKFINHYARIAQANNVEMLCIGCELDKLDTGNYANWAAVISGVRAIYSGPLIYASQWFSYMKIPFWGLLDYVGIDAYYPLSASKTPAVAEIVSAWTAYTYFGVVRNWAQELETWHATVNKPIIFTEIGYRSIDYTAKNPADFGSVSAYNGNGQANCYKAALLVFSNKPWFAGLFWWDWHPDPTDGGAGDTDFTPHDKPAQSVLAAYW